MDKIINMTRIYIFISIILSLSHQGLTKVIEISLANRVPTLTNSEIFSVILPYNQWTSNSMIKLNNISSEIYFLIVQAHTQYDNIVLSYDAIPTIGTAVNGTNIGLIIYPTERSTLYLLNFARNAGFNTHLSVHAYFMKAPVPGGCNMEFNVRDAPYLQLTHNSHIINVDAAPPGIYNTKKCNLLPRNITMDFYHMYFAKKDVSNDEYFKSMKKMMTVENILKYGRKVSNIYGYGQMRRVFSLYPDIGSVYGVVVTDGNYTAAHVPIHTYGCSTSSTCQYPTYLVTVMYVAACIGLFLCIFGHFFFKVHILALGFISTSLLSYFIIASAANLTSEEVFIISVVCGAIGGIGWLIHWCCCSIPITIMLLNSFCFGIIAAAITYFGLPDSRPFFELDINYWWGFVLVILICQLILMFMWHFSIMLTCAVLGSFLVIIPLDIAIGSYLRYILINLIRRVSVTNFNLAVIDPPYQWRDIATTVSWILIALCGMKIQWTLSKYRAPFPPPSSASCSCSPCIRNSSNRLGSWFSRVCLFCSSPRSAYSQIETHENNVNGNAETRRLLGSVYPNYSSPQPYVYSQTSAPSAPSIIW